jgi:hypothetical protein
MLTINLFNLFLTKIHLKYSLVPILLEPNIAYTQTDVALEYLFSLRLNSKKPRDSITMSTREAILFNFLCIEHF